MTWLCLKVEGGWSCCLRAYLRAQLLDPAGLMTGGVALTLGGQPVMLYAKVGCILADGDGHMKAFDWKGASCLKPCLRHFNVFKKAALGVTLCGGWEFRNTQLPPEQLSNRTVARARRQAAK